MWEDMADSSKKDRKEQRSPSVSMCRKESVPRGSRPGRRGREKRQPRAVTFSLKHWTATKSSAQGWAADSLVECLPSMRDTLGSLPSAAENQVRWCVLIIQSLEGRNGSVGR